MYLNIKTVSNCKEIDYSNFSEPILISQGCLSMPAVKRWSVEYLSQIFKDTPINIEVYQNRDSMGETNVNKHQEKPFREVINHIMTEKPPFFYFAEIAISEYEKDIGTFLKQDIQNDFDRLRKPVEELIFMGYDSLSGCHLHINDDYILNQIIGTKTIYLFHYRDNPQLKMRSFLDKNNNFLKDNFFKLDHSKLKIYKVILKPGNSLVIPPWWFHAVQGNKFSCSITKVYQRSNIDYLKKYKYLSFLYDLEDYIKIGLNVFLGALILFLIIFLTLYFLNHSK